MKERKAKKWPGSLAGSKHPRSATARHLRRLKTEEKSMLYSYGGNMYVDYYMQTDGGGPCYKPGERIG